MKNLRFKIIYTLAVLLTLFIISCKEEESVNEEVVLSRMFRPSTLLTEIVNGTQVTLTWTGIADARFLVQTSMDSLLFTTNLKDFFVEDATHLVLENLLSNTRYSARVKSISKKGISADSGWKEITFKTGQ